MNNVRCSENKKNLNKLKTEKKNVFKNENKNANKIYTRFYFIIYPFHTC